MSLPENFQFSQANLSDYVDCARRFQLRYLLEQDWPAVESEPLLERERFADLGRRFHKLIQQHVEGISIDALTQSANEPELARWWQNYLQHIVMAGEATSSGLPPDRRAEVAISIPLGKYRLTAHLDLIAAEADRLVIVDWKTERKRPTRDQLLKRMQTRVYRYIVTEAYQRTPGTVSMIYWFAEFPDRPEILQYDAAQHTNDRDFLNQLIQEIETGAQADGDWDKTPDEHKCAYCTYRSLCNRGISAGAIDPDAEDYDQDISLSLDEIDEIAY